MKNELLDVKFAECTENAKKIALGIDETLLKQSRFKGMEIDNIIKQLWNGRTNSQKRKILAVALNQR
jgi:hypothetical protein